MRKAFDQHPIQNGALLALGLAFLFVGAFAMHLGLSSPEVNAYATLPIVGFIAIAVGIGGAIWVFARMERYQRRISGEPTSFMELSSVRFFIGAIALVLFAVLSSELHNEHDTRKFILGAISFLAIIPMGLYTLYYLFDWVASNRNHG